MAELKRSNSNLGSEKDVVDEVELSNEKHSSAGLRNEATERISDAEKNKSLDGDQVELQEKEEPSTEVKDEDDAAKQEADDASKYPSGTKLAMLTFGLAMATFVVALDNTIIATAIPRITTDFHALNDVGWYGSSYLLTTTSLQPSFGKVYAYFDVKWVYLSALIIFEGKLPSRLASLGALASR